MRVRIGPGDGPLVEWPRVRYRIFASGFRSAYQRISRRPSGSARACPQFHSRRRVPTNLRTANSPSGCARVLRSLQGQDGPPKHRIRWRGSRCGHEKIGRAGAYFDRLSRSCQTEKDSMAKRDEFEPSVPIVQSLHGGLIRRSSATASVARSTRRRSLCAAAHKSDPAIARTFQRSPSGILSAAGVVDHELPGSVGLATHYLSAPTRHRHRLAVGGQCR